MKFQLISLAAVCLGLSAGELLRPPYLPSGWRPKGPAFELPTETKKTVEPTTESTQDFESAGSTFLREYGPPNTVQEAVLNPIQDFAEELQPRILPGHILQDLTYQALPDVQPNLSFRINENTSVKEEERNEKNILDIADNLNAEVTDETLIKLAVNENEDTTEITTMKVVENNDDSVQSKAIDVTNKANYDVVLINEPVGDLTSKVQIENDYNEVIPTVRYCKCSGQLNIANNAAVRPVEVKIETKSTPVGFLEYGPPAEATTFRAPAYLPPQPIKRDARRASTHQGVGSRK